MSKHGYNSVLQSFCEGGPQETDDPQKGPVIQGFDVVSYDLHEETMEQTAKFPLI